MANYQRPYNSTLNHPGENNAGAQSTGASHPAQHAQGAMDNTPAYHVPNQIPAASEAEDDTAFDPAHTCATCSMTCLNNYALEKHAAKECHKAFLCTCTTGFGRLGSLNRHIAAQAGPKHHCIYCDGDKGFAREDKLIDHLRASHKFGEKAIAQFRSQARAQIEGNGHASHAVATTGIALPVSTSAGYDAAPGGLVDQAGYSAGPSAGPAGTVDGGLDDFSMFSGAGVQPFGSVEDYPLFDAAEDLTGFDFSGIDFTGVDFPVFGGDLDMSGMDNMM